MTDQTQTSNRLVEAKVEWWSRSSIHVRSPHCPERSSQYNSCYEIRFPFSVTLDEVGYEIDKQRALFVAGGADPTEYFLEKEGDPLPYSFDENVKIRRKWTEATETIHFDENETGIPGGYTAKRIDWVVGEMVLGNVEYVRRYLESSTESDIFLNGVEAWEIRYPNGFDSSEDGGTEDPCPPKGCYQTSGKTALHLVAREKYPRMIELLLRKGADPTAASHWEASRDMAMGRIAALWGRLENVKLLLKYGANKDLECVRNGQRTLAINFARPLKSNAKERYSRSGREHQVYKENTYTRDLDRRAIVRMLGAGTENTYQRHRDLTGFAFMKSQRAENLLTLVAHFDVPGKWKTIAVLYRGSQFRCVAAMSGWAHVEDHAINIQVAGRDWTPEVRRLCETVEYILAPDGYDQGEPGSYHACHAEKQLIAFFVNKHLFLPHEFEEDFDLARQSSLFRTRVRCHSDRYLYHSSPAILQLHRRPRVQKKHQPRCLLAHATRLRHRLCQGDR
ncbi:hypothetical protein K469DRAFT_564403 [Zopfia rhizophila CBS 207.26]|uniref:Single-strand DNA deaminase toxin A-like C-terminal domain-containing protein n=1 Tax=Zopfia rhizophila CBS 207.26 TaxID=1314779 RepID=A0A6A6EDJ1_9PEZI|nr:hypothetical protein K469DRAFT_564403 [Zopfia rhizophila CBS 207.26]